MRRTHAVVQVALAIMEDPTGDHYGYELSNKAGVRSGVMYPILSRFLRDGIVEDGWESEEAAAARGAPGRPRRYYKLTGDGQRELVKLLNEARQDDRFKQAVIDRLRAGVAW